MEREYFVVDAFASEPFTGNPAAVVLDSHGLTDLRMLAIAKEFNLSETTFVLPPNHDAKESDGLALQFRWFTPGVEVKMCGHATIAAIHALVESDRLAIQNDTDAATLTIDTHSGRLRGFAERIPGRRDERMYWLELPDPVLTERTGLSVPWLQALGLNPADVEGEFPCVRTQDDDVIAFVRDVATLHGIRPDFSRLGGLMAAEAVRGLSLATVRTLTPSVHVQSRFFAPASGIDEDPVTGSVHGALAAILAERGLAPAQDGQAAITAVQGIPGGRSGLLFVLVEPKADGGVSARIGGRAVTIMRGTLRV
jgi:PhzF family phenazine biosynthesis protein